MVVFQQYCGSKVTETVTGGFNGEIQSKEELNSNKLNSSRSISAAKIKTQLSCFFSLEKKEKAILAMDIYTTLHHKNRH